MEAVSLAHLDHGGVGPRPAMAVARRRGSGGVRHEHRAGHGEAKGQQLHGHSQCERQRELTGGLERAGEGRGRERERVNGESRASTRYTCTRGRGGKRA